MLNAEFQLQNFFHLKTKSKLFPSPKANRCNTNKRRENDHLCVSSRRFNDASERERSRYEDDFLAYLQQVVSEVDRRIRKGHSRLSLSNAQQHVRKKKFLHKIKITDLGPEVLA